MLNAPKMLRNSRVRGRTAAAVSALALVGVFATAVEPAAAAPLATDPCIGATATITGTSGSNFLVGTSGPDVIFGLGGNDTIWGEGGDDLLCGGTGDDRLDGDDGNDTL